jgi:hypothetical protein
MLTINGRKMIPEKNKSMMNTRSQEKRCSKKGEKIISTIGGEKIEENMTDENWKTDFKITPEERAL